MAIAFAFVAVKFQMETYLLATPASRSPQSYSRIWFTNQDILTGANVSRGVLHIDRLPGSAASYGRSWEVPIGSASHWTVSTDLSHAAWIDGGNLHTERLSDESRSVIPLPAKVPMGVSVLPDASIAVVFSDASVSRWDSNSKQPLGELHLKGLDTADQSTAREDYIAIASDRVHTVALYRFRNGEWVSAETLPAPESPFQLAIPASGTLATISSGHLRTGKKPRNTLGAVSSVVSFRGVAVVAGDFEKVWALSDYDQGQPQSDYEIAPAPVNAILAAGRDHLALSDSQGTSILKASIDQRLTPAGRFTAFIAALEILAAGLLMLAPWLFRLLLEYLASLAKKRGKHERAGIIPQVLPDPPPGLVALLAGEKAVLWAGAGLSAQSGLPVRKAFAGNLLQSAQLEGSLEPSLYEKLKRRVDRGETEAALEVLFETMSLSKFASYADAILPHFITPSRSHELLGQLRFSAAFTTNYDDLLSIMDVPWSSDRLTARGKDVERAINMPCLLKWYGNLTDFSTILMTRQQLAAAAAESRAANLFQRMMLNRGVVFVGASLEGIKADLEALNVPHAPAGGPQAPKPSPPKHYAITGVCDAGWKGLALELSELYGIEALVCSEHTIGTELPEFLEKLVNSVTAAPTSAARSHTEPVPHPVHR